MSQTISKQKSKLITYSKKRGFCFSVLQLKNNQKSQNNPEHKNQLLKLSNPNLKYFFSI